MLLFSFFLFRVQCARGATTLKINRTIAIFCSRSAFNCYRNRQNNRKCSIVLKSNNYFMMLLLPNGLTPCKWKSHSFALHTFTLLYLHITSLDFFLIAAKNLCAQWNVKPTFNDIQSNRIRLYRSKAPRENLMRFLFFSFLELNKIQSKLT